MGLRPGWAPRRRPGCPGRSRSPPWPRALVGLHVGRMTKVWAPGRRYSSELVWLAVALIALSGLVGFFVYRAAERSPGGCWSGRCPMGSRCPSRICGPRSYPGTGDDIRPERPVRGRSYAAVPAGRVYRAGRGQDQHPVPGQQRRRRQLPALSRHPTIACPWRAATRSSPYPGCPESRLCEHRPSRDRLSASPQRVWLMPGVQACTSPPGWHTVRVDPLARHCAGSRGRRPVVGDSRAPLPAGQPSTARSFCQ